MTVECFVPRLLFHFEGGQDMLFQNMSLWHKHYFECSFIKNFPNSYCMCGFCREHEGKWEYLWYPKKSQNVYEITGEQLPSLKKVRFGPTLQQCKFPCNKVLILHQSEAVSRESSTAQRDSSLAGTVLGWSVV